MTVKVEVIEGGVPHQKIMIAGIVCTIVCLYLSYLNALTSTGWFSFFGGLAAVSALIWGSHTIKVLCSYGIGTGVPSAGMIAFGSGVIAMLLATKFGNWAPIAAAVFAAIIGLILGYLANDVLNMKIPAMVQALTELAVVGALTLMGLAVLITGSFTFAGLTSGTVTLFGVLAMPSYQVSFIGGGLIAVAFLLGAMAVQHPFNACLGPGWKQDRMLMLAAECGFVSMIVGAVMSFAIVSAGSATISVVVALIGWLYTYKHYFILSKRDAAAWLDVKPIPEMEGH